MAKHPWDRNSNTDETASPACRVAYILNNDQPVRCTIIGDQPLLYLDFNPSVDEEEETLFLSEDDIIIEALDMPDYETLSARVEATSAARLEAFQTAISALDEAQENDDSNVRLDSILKQMRRSRLAEAYIDFAVYQGVTIAFEAGAETCEYSRHNARIIINPQLNDSDVILSLSKELRRLWQHRNGAMLNPLTFHPDHAVLVHRAQQADLAVSVVRIAWELQLSGVREPWDDIEHSSLKDLAHVLAREAYLDFRTLNNGIACSAVFESWFLSERCRHEDKVLIQEMLADYGGYVFTSVESSKMVTAELISALGSMPFGKNYLAPFVTTLMDDPVFGEIRDRSNANFLWFIKFERSFRQTERDLQMNPADHSAGHASSPYMWAETKDSLPQNFEKPVKTNATNNVIAVSFKNAKGSAKKTKASLVGSVASGQSGQVIDIHTARRRKFRREEG